MYLLSSAVLCRRLSGQIMSPTLGNVGDGGSAQRRLDTSDKS